MSITTPIYLDNHATTRTDPRALDAMLPYFTEIYGNAASISHRYGWDAEAAVGRARGLVADLIGAEPEEIVFVSGATEADNLAIKGVAAASLIRGPAAGGRNHGHLVVSAIEHRATLDAAKRLAREGFRLTLVQPDVYGMINPDTVAAALEPDTILVSVMAANNEIGTINPIGEIGRLCRDRGIPFHTDAAQAAGKIPIDVEADAIDLLSFTAHKMHGPKGIGALYVRRRGRPVQLLPLFDGGGHERGWRSGTIPVPLAVGFGVAAELAQIERDAEIPRIRGLRDRLYARIVSQLDGVRINGHPEFRLPGNLHLAFEGIDGEALMRRIRDIAVSAGAACSSATPAPSHVLEAIGLDEDLSRASLRFGVGRFNTEDEIDFAAAYLVDLIRKMRSARSPA